ncbi:PQQ-binding-like beta-propeller repeat protein [Micromonospora sp. NPDC050276]|uniref:outer membrane protein assembly factor BamB family protein n=1 Tax=Micromonospora sp. NPDC050276 TaxID=3364278 RepID=UPI0037968B14
MTGPVIDLGELRHGSDPDPLPRPPRANGRSLRCALALLLVLVTVGAAAAPPPRRSVVTLPVRPGADVLIDGDLLLGIEPINDTRTLQRRLAAYRLPSGAPVWQASLPGEARYWGIAPVAGMLLVTGYEIGVDSQSSLTVALDRATGAYRWQQPGSATLLADGSLLLQAGGEGQPVSLRAVDACCGNVRWQLPAAANVEVQHSGRGAARVVLHQRNGPTEVRDAATGSVLARADLRPPGGEPLDFVQVINDLLVTIGGEPTTVTGYGLDRLDRRWTSTRGRVEFSADCGPVLCLRTGANELQAIDIATGELRWRSDRWRWGWPFEGRLMVSASDGGAVEHYLVLDALTGRQLADLGQWSLFQLGVGGRLVGVRRHPDSGMLVGELDIRAGKVRILDVLPEAVGNCQAIVDHLLCTTPNGSYQLWTLPD